MLIMKTKLLLPFCVLTLVFYSCDKDFDVEKQNSHEFFKASMRGPVVYSTSFDWENINRITTASGQIVDMPWYGANFLPDRMKHSHPKSDGWEMVYNTLDINQSVTTPAFFALYNKYLGIMHLFYVDLWGLESSEAFYGAFCIKGNSSLFNFDGVNKTLEEKVNYPTLVKGSEGSISNGTTYKYIPYQSFVTRNWYGTEIEFSYEDVSSFSDQNFYLQYIPYRGKSSNITLTGDLEGTIDGTIEGRSSGNTNLIGSIGSIFSNSSNDNSVNVGNSTVIGTITSALEKAKTQSTGNFWTRLWGKIKKEVPGAAESAITSTLTSAVNQGIKWATNPLSAFVSSVFSIGGSSSSVPLNKVDLKINAKISIEGTISSQVANLSYDLKLPNTISEMGGFGYPTSEMKDWGLGVWNIEGLPTVNYDITNFIFVINGHAVSEPCASQLELTIPSADVARININPRVEQDCYIVSKSIKYIVETGNYENIQDIDYLEPFAFKQGTYGFSQSYIFPNTEMVFLGRDFHQSDNCGFNIYARATLVLKHKITGKEFVHIKDFNLPYSVNKRYITGDPEALDLPF